MEKYKYVIYKYRSLPVNDELPITAAWTKQCT